MFRKLTYSLIIAVLIFTLAFGAEVRRAFVDDLDLQQIDGGPAETTVSPGGKSGTRIHGGALPWDNSYSRTIRPGDIITGGPWVDLRKFLPVGYVTDNSVDYSTQVQQWVDNCSVNHRKCTAPAGKFRIDSTITISDLSDWIIEGIPTKVFNTGTTFVWGGVDNGTMFNVSGARGFEINDIQLDGNSKAGVGLWAQKSASNAFSSFNSRNLFTKNMRGYPGVGLYLGQTATGTGMNDLNIYDYSSYINREAVRIDGAGGQSIKFYGGVIYCESQTPILDNTIGFYFNNGGFLTTVDTQITYCKDHYKMGTASAILNVFGGYHEYAVHDTLLNWVNHNGVVNIIGTLHAGPTDNTIVYGGGILALNSMGNNFTESDNNVLAAAGSQLVKLTSMNDTFGIAGAGWVNNTSYNYTYIVAGGKVKDGPIGSLVWDPGTILDNTGVTSSAITLGTALAWGDTVEVGAPYDLAGVVATAYVSNAAAGNVDIRLYNRTGSSFAPGSGTWKVRVRRAW